METTFELDPFPFDDRLFAIAQDNSFTVVLAFLQMLNGLDSNWKGRDPILGWVTIEVVVI